MKWAELEDLLSIMSESKSFLLLGRRSCIGAPTSLETVTFSETKVAVQPLPVSASTGE